jgi:K319-like protein
MQSYCRKWIVVVTFSFLCVGVDTLAETGMGLIIDKTNKVARRVDLRDNQIIFTSPPIGVNVAHGRFSPDGNRLAYVDEAGMVFACDLDGNVQNSFQAFSTGSVSWTSSGIWIGGEGKAEYYDPDTGASLGEIIPTGVPDAFKIKFRIVSHSETSYSALDHPPPIAKVVLLDQSNVVFDLGSGCSVGPSPDGTMFTHNLWESGLEHQTMWVQDRSAQILHDLYLFDIIPYPAAETDKWSWNSQSWSSNSQDIILIPAGRGFPQMDDSTMPWIYNLASGQANCLHVDPYAWDVYWHIDDFYEGKVGVVIPEVNIERFEAVPPAIRNGESSSIEWRVTEATQVRLDGQVVAAEGTQSVSPSATTTYNLEADGEGGPKSAQVILTVSDNLPPQVDAGPDLEVGVDVLTAVNASVSDDGFPSGSLTLQWTQESGPDTVVFGQPAQEDTSISCPQEGEYILRLTASDGELSAFDEINVSAVQEQQMSIQILAPQNGDVWIVGDSKAIEWTTVGIDDVVIYLSSDDGAGWTPLAASIDDQSPDWGSLAWQVPDQPSTECWVRMESYFGEAPTQSGPFTIALPTEEDEIVVKGGCSCGPENHRQPLGLLLLGLVVFFGSRCARTSTKQDRHV